MNFRRFNDDRVFEVAKFFEVLAEPSLPPSKMLHLRVKSDVWHVFLRTPRDDSVWHHRRSVTSSVATIAKARRQPQQPERRIPCAASVTAWWSIQLFAVFLALSFSLSLSLSLSLASSLAPCACGASRSESVSRDASRRSVVVNRVIPIILSRRRYIGDRPSRRSARLLADEGT